MNGDQWGQVLEFISRLWDRPPLTAEAAAETFPMFEDVDLRDAQAGVKDLFASGRDHPPNASVLYAASEQARVRRTDRERRERAIEAGRSTPTPDPGANWEKASVEMFGEVLPFETAIRRRHTELVSSGRITCKSPDCDVDHGPGPDTPYEGLPVRGGQDAALDRGSNL